MITVRIDPANFPRDTPGEIYPAWLADRLREGGIKFTGLPYLIAHPDEILDALDAPWEIERKPDGVLIFRQGIDKQEEPK